jgi:hypothetical protein
MLLSIACTAQSLERSVLASAGTSANGTLQIDYTIGEAVVIPFAKENILLTQGFQQPVYFNRAITNVFPYFVIYPNPTRGDAQARFVLSRPVTLTISIYSATGQLLSTESISYAAGEMQYIIRSNTFVAGTYMIQFMVNDGSTEISRKLVKVN